jgi:hypothetical protein
LRLNLREVLQREDISPTTKQKVTRAQAKSCSESKRELLRNTRLDKVLSKISTSMIPKHSRQIRRRPGKT